jgi:uncharacterized protein (TIGR02118 family)
MAALIVLFNLKNESDRQAYEHWARTTDVPTVKKLGSVDDFKVYRLNAVMGAETPPPYQYCEVIAINDMNMLGQEVASDTMRKVAAEFQAFADNPIFIIAEQFA